MTIEGLAGLAGPKNDVGTIMLGKALDQSQSTMAQLLQGLPAAPQPAHLGRNVDVRA